MSLGEVGRTIESKLKKNLAPIELTVRDDSHHHAGHAGARPEGETHFHVHIVSQRFAGLTPVARHRLVNEILADELKGPVHALAISASPPPQT